MIYFGDKYKYQFRLAKPLNVLTALTDGSFTLSIEATYSNPKCCKITVFQNLLMILEEFFNVMHYVA